MKQNSDSVAKKLSSEQFVGLVLKYDPRVRAFITTLMLPCSDVEDVFQNTCMAAFRKLQSFEYVDESPDEEFVRWACTIAKFEVLRFYRSRRVGRVVFSSDVIEQLADMQMDESRDLQNREEALKRCISELPPRQQGIIAMRYGEDVSVVEMARRVGQTANGIYKSLERIRKRLMACIGRRLRAEGLG